MEFRHTPAIAFLKSIPGFCPKLSLPVVAEGVENGAQLEGLVSHGDIEVQTSVDPHHPMAWQRTFLPIIGGRNCEVAACLGNRKAACMFSVVSFFLFSTLLFEVHP
ncbi:hypothetical protein P3W85_17695 [Cupriavidus basilensis]|uniref:EAL domain-containing protein n=1 Tax=Cupriavidus basilensis TaxID=68895 RepID=A0ABT6ASV4_9BURK|nr:hypothetical protein [Cupriavidus basilensis]MDF3834776.1 hypothetical protein [Cupriavidus basilensis]